MKNFGPWRILVSALVVGAFSLLGWSLIETNGLGKTKVDKEEFVRHEVENRADFKETQEIIRDQQKDLTTQMNEIKGLILELHRGD
jgi:hypothetical protein